MPVTELSDEDFNELMYGSYSGKPFSEETPEVQAQIREDWKKEEEAVTTAESASKAANVSGVQLEKGAAELASGSQPYSVSQSVQPENQQVQTR